MDKTICIQGRLLPGGTFVQDVTPGVDGRSQVIEALNCLPGPIDFALATDDPEAAVRIATGILEQVADTLADPSAPIAAPDQMRFHALSVELECLPLECNSDGSLVDRGMGVSMRYRNWEVEDERAETMATALAAKCQARWPNAWHLLPARETTTPGLRPLSQELRKCG